MASLTSSDLKSLPKLILLRHGESDWNKKNLFTGWVDIPLSVKGIEEAIAAGKSFNKVPVDVIFTSTLIRAQMTGMLAMAQHSIPKTPYILHTGEGKQEEWSKMYNDTQAANTIPVHRAWEINERYYGELQAMNKDEARQKYGEEQVKIWRRSYDVPPPKGESLEMTAARSIPFFEKNIVPHLSNSKKNVLIAAHGNSLRSIVMKLDSLSREQVIELEIATGKPLCYVLKDGKFLKTTIDDVQKAY